MMPIRRCLPFVLLLLTACASGPRVQRTERLAVPLAEQVDVELRLTQRQIRVAYDVSNAGGAAAMQVAATPGGVAGGSFAGGAAAGLIGALIDTAVTAHRGNVAKERERPIHANTADLPIDEMIQRSFDALDRKQFAENLVLKKLDHAEADDASAKRLEPGSNILVLDPTYSVSYDDSFFAYVLNVRLVDRTKDAKGRITSKERYRQSIQYVLPQSGSPGGVRWSDLTSAQWRQVLETATGETVAMLNYDIGAYPSEAQPQRRYGNMIVLLDQERGERAWVRTGWSLLSVPVSQLKAKK